MPAARSYSRMQYSFGGGSSGSGARALPSPLVALRRQYNVASPAAASGALGSNAADQQLDLQLAAVQGGGSNSGGPPGSPLRSPQHKQPSAGSCRFSSAHSNGTAGHPSAASSKRAGAGGTGDVVLYMADGGSESGVARVPSGAAAMAGSGAVA